jgi:hypothetical protein
MSIAKGNENELTHFQKMLVFDKISDPRVTHAELAKKYNCTPPNISVHFTRAKVKAFLAKCENEMFERVKLMRVKAAENWMNYINEGNTDRAERASALMMKSVVEAPASMPNGPLDFPEFVDTKTKEDDQ